MSTGSKLLAILSTFLLLLTLTSSEDSDYSEEDPDWPEAWTEWDRMDEEDRVVEHNHYFGWPPKIIPETEGWRKLSERRINQVRYIKSDADKYDAWIQTMASAVSQPNFTEFGWALTRAPQNLTDTLRQAVHDGLPTARSEGYIDVINGLTPIFIDRPELMKRALDELWPIHEAWSQEKLRPYIAYGFRLYRNQSSLLMHIDKSNTHIISCIFHIDSSEDAEPWPVLIEDFAGNTNEVILKSGDMLLYESSKCFHGRPGQFNGSWYSSIFVHYYPVKEEWTSVNHDFMGHYAVPEDWNEIPDQEPTHPTLIMQGTSMQEPDCEHGWCELAYGRTIKWEGPAEEHYALTSGGKRYHLYGQDYEKEKTNEL